jgi:hypothetical protein
MMDKGESTSFVDAMERHKLKWVGLVLVGALPFSASAQAPFNLEADSKPQSAVELGGIPALDIVSLRALGPGTPLRYGNIIPSSESVQLDGRRLTRGQDYAMDYEAGVVYLKVAQREGQSMSVSYRYSKEPSAKQASPFAGIGGFKFQVAPKSLNVIMGLGMAERATDGSVMQTNVFGFNNSFKFGGSQVNGVYLYGDRVKASNQAGLSFDRNEQNGGAQTDEGKSQMILQGLTSKLLGGEATLDYQDVDKNFANFSSAKQAGLDDATLTRLQKEKGMTRFGMALKDVRIGSAALSQTYRTIGDEQGGVSWRSLGMKQGGLQVNWSSQKVDDNFNRFNDIAEDDRQQLMREKGMSRESRGLELAQKFGKMSFNSSRIDEDASGKTIRREEIALDTSAIKFNLGEQEVEEGFSRIGSLKGEEQGLYGRELGVKRQWMGLQASLFGAKNTPISFNQSLLKDKDGSFKSQDITAGGSSWSLQVSERASSRDFTRMSAMSDQEANGHVEAIAKMYGPNVNPQGNDRAKFLSGAGLSRDFSRFAFQPFRNWKADFSQLGLKGRKTGSRGFVTNVEVASPNLDFKYRKKDLRAEFEELTSMMDFERAQLGTIVGLERTDLGMNLRLGGQRKASISKMIAKTADGALRRSNLGYQDRKIEVEVTTREVASGFANANQLVDAERDLLASMRGFKGTEGKLKWELLPGMKLDARISDAVNDGGDQFRHLRDFDFNWTPNSKTQIQYQKQEQKSSDPLSTLFANRVDRMMVAKDFGRLGRMRILDEVHRFDGEEASQPDMRRQYLAYETDLSKTTSVRTEQTRTRYDNGDKENVSANTVSTALSKRMGVAITDVDIDRQGEERDEKKRNYGLWMDLGSGLMLSYGYARHLNGENGTMNSTVSLGPNKDAARPEQVPGAQNSTVGNLEVGAAYGVNEWEQDSRTQAFSKINLKNAKGFSLGPLQDFKFQLGLDTAADRAKWLRENKLFGFSGKLGSQSVAYEYRGQINPTGARGIDRTFRWDTGDSAASWLKASIMYKLRTLPSNEQVMIRDYNITAKLTGNTQLTHQLQTNPEVTRGDALLGSIVQASRSNKWSFDLRSSANLTLGAVWQELVNEQAQNLARNGGITMTLFQGTGSPLTLYYGVEQARMQSLDRTKHRYHLQFDQRPGPNQTLSFFLGNVSYEHSIEENFKRNNWTMRLDYQIRF